MADFKVTLTDADLTQADSCIEFVRDMLKAKAPESLSDYEYNVLVALSQSSIDSRMVGIVASAIPFYLREIGKMEERKRASLVPSKHLGKVGEKIEFDALLLGCFPHETQYGVSYITKMITPSGDILTWFASNDMTTDDPAAAATEGLLCKGVTVHVTGTVKKHDSYKNQLQTVVTRCTVWTALGLQQAAEKAAKKLAREAKKAAKAAAGK